MRNAKVPAPVLVDPPMVHPRPGIPGLTSSAWNNTAPQLNYCVMLTGIQQIARWNIALSATVVTPSSRVREVGTHYQTGRRRFQRTLPRTHGRGSRHGGAVGGRANFRPESPAGHVRLAATVPDKRLALLDERLKSMSACFGNRAGSRR